jgi:hypothetical protein
MDESVFAPATADKKSTAPPPCQPSQPNASSKTGQITRYKNRTDHESATNLVERDCTNDSGGPLLSDGRIRTTKPGFFDGAKAVISGSVSVIDRCAVSRAGHASKQPLGIAQVPGRRPTSEVARCRYRRDRSPQSRHSRERNRYGCGYRDVTEPICGVS